MKPSKFAQFQLILMILLQITIQSCKDANCSKCISQYIKYQCLECNSSYFVKSLQCSSCSNNCLTCTSETNCQQCQDGYYLLSNACPMCSSPCSKCIDTDTNCTDCIYGYLLIGSQCFQCTPPCTTCQNNIQNCLTCVDSVNQNPATCQCGNNQYMTQQYNCLNCIAPCETCSDATVCLSCLSGYFLSGNTCQLCKKPCNTCSQSEINCTSCMDSIQILQFCECPSGYILDSNSYLCCTYQCSSCQNNGTECYSCADTYTYNQQSHTCNCLISQFEMIGTPNVCQDCKQPCLTCENSDTNCLSCISGTTLSNNECKCSDGYYFDTTLNSCTFCQLPCTKCTSLTFCLECNISEQILNDCHCPDGKFLNTSSTCDICKENCSKCTNQNDCSQCEDNFYLSNQSCLACELPCQKCEDTSKKCLSCFYNLQNVIDNNCVCDEGYYMDSQYQCQTCQYPCIKCQLNADDCTECQSSYIKTNSNSCICEDGKFLDLTINPNVCSQCQIPCKTCQNNENQCLDCIDLNQILISNRCECQLGWLINTNFLCDPCQIPCTECQGTLNFCTKCKDLLHTIDNGNCQCPVLYGNDDNYFCIFICEPPCKTCQLTKTQCLTCTDPKHIKNNSEQCVCVDGYYSNTVSTCAQCQLPCDNCDNLGCLTCKQGIQILENHICKCPSQYLMINNVCEMCEQSCESCQNTLLQCLSCLDPLKSAVNYKCICNNGYYLSGDDCNECQYPCKYCENQAYFCTLCDEALFTLKVNKCVCLKGYTFSLTQQNVCEPCSFPCKTCSDNIYICTSCQDTELYQLKLIKCVCNKCYYEENGLCLKCSHHCETCFQTKDNCLSCKNLEVKLLNDCLCDYGYYENLELVCKQCQSPCQTCVYNYDICLTCDSDLYYLQNNKCLCKNGYYLKNFQCYSCKTECIKCENYQTCTECKDGYFLINQNCELCNIGCKTCINQSYCLICSDGYFMDIFGVCQSCQQSCQYCINTSDCIKCFDGSYFLDQQCFACSRNCQNCESDYSNCISCRINYQLSNENKCECKIGYYEENFECKKCQYPCFKCLEQDICQECHKINNLYLNDDSNKCECDSGYFWSDNKCQKCNFKCHTCIDYDQNCTTCNYAQFRIIKQNECICSIGYFENNQQECETCNSEKGKIIEFCKFYDCTDQIWTYGEKCDDGNNVTRDGCTNCIIDENYSCFNQILQKSICYQCSSNCNQCQLSEDSNQVICNQCQSGYFIDHQSCSKCSDKCLGCKSKSNDCISCRFIKNSQGECQLCESEVGSYSNFELNSCYTKCGDGIKSKNEECDDGNIIDGDGCNSNCKQEQKFVCKDATCITPSYPMPSLKIIGDTSEYQQLRQFELTYDQELSINQNFKLQDYFNLFLIFDNKERIIDYEFNLTQNLIYNENQQQYGNVILKINLLISNDSSNEQLLIKFHNQTEIKSYQGYSQQETQIKCQIMPVIFIQQDTVKQVESATASNQYALYTVGVMSGGAIVFGGIEIFFNLLDTLQLLSYLKYINANYPFNLGQYFDMFGFVQLNYIQKYFDLNQLLEYCINFDQLKKPPEKISQDNFSSLFIINAATILFIYFLLAATYGLSMKIPKLLNKMQFKYYSDSLKNDQWRLQLGLYFLSFKLLIQKMCYMMISELFYSGIQRVHLSSAYDFAFSSVLQLNSLQLTSDDILVQISSILAIIASILYFLDIYFVITVSGMRCYALKNYQNILKYGSIFNGVNTKNRVARYFTAIQLIKKYFFMVILILAYEFPILQVASLTLVSLLNVLIMTIFKPIDDFPEFIKQIACEINISFTLMSITLLTYDDQANYFTYATRQNIGWSCIFFLSALILIQMVIDTIQQWIMLFRKFKKIQIFVNSIKRLLFHENVQTSNPNIFLTS